MRQHGLIGAEQIRPSFHVRHVRLDQQSAGEKHLEIFERDLTEAEGRNNGLGGAKLLEVAPARKLAGVEAAAEALANKTALGRNRGARIIRPEATGRSARPRRSACNEPPGEAKQCGQWQTSVECHPRGAVQRIVRKPRVPR
jgi:hypothetical protein